MEVYIDKFDDLGNGIARIDNKVCFVKNALPQELVDIQIIKNKKNYCEGKVLKVIEKSDMRETPVCPNYLECGGCNFLHLKKREEIKFKQNKILNYFNKLDYFYETSNYNYRNKIVLHVKNGKIGYYQEKTNEIVEIDYCFLVKDKINKIIKLLKKNVDNNFSGTITIRVNNKDQSLISIQGNYKYVDSLKNEELVDNLIYNDKVLKGNEYFYEELLDYKFKVHYKSFFQVNILGLISISKVLREFLNSKNINNALDLYSGTSVLGILMSNYVGNVVSIESNKNASYDAVENIKINNINNLDAINGLVEDNIDKFQNIDLVLVDPARRGLDKKTINYLKQIKSNYLIYIACGIDSLKRDASLLEDTYKIDKIYGIDMFPCTNNVETMVIFSLK